MLKTLLIIGSLLLGGNGVLADGSVYFINSSLTFITTNGTGGSGLISGGSGSFYFGLFIAPSGTTDTDILDPTWTFTGVYATNTSPGLLTGGPLALVSGWEPGTTKSYTVAGWSANLGHDWPLISSQLDDGSWIENGFFGQSAIGSATAGGRLPSGIIRLPPPLFALEFAGSSLNAGFSLNEVPEPNASLMLALGLVITYFFGSCELSGLRSRGIV
jgi:hypothetical protein